MLPGNEIKISLFSNRYDFGYNVSHSLPPLLLPFPQNNKKLQQLLFDPSIYSVQISFYDLELLRFIAQPNKNTHTEQEKELEWRFRAVCFHSQSFYLLLFILERTQSHSVGEEK
jgi:hypothetical protein